MFGLDDIDPELLREFMGGKVPDGHCPGCSMKNNDLRPWPPDRPGAVKLCGNCRLKRALKLRAA